MALDLPKKILYQKRLIDQELARRMHEQFMRYTWARGFDPFVVGPHTRVICNRFDRAMDDFAAGVSTYLAVQVPQGHGKLLCDLTPMMTSNGWSTHGELNVGDKVLDRNGEFVKVIGVSAYALAGHLVKFSDGSSVAAHENHEWVVYDKCRHKERVVETKEMLDDFSHKTRSFCRYRIDYNTPIKFKAKELVVPPYVLGCWLGDGSTTKNCITYHPDDLEMIDKIKSLGYGNTKTSIHKSTDIYTTYFYKLYKDLVKKRIPDCYKFSSIEQRLELLAGLIDTDGYVAKSGKVVFSNTNKCLIDDVVELIRSLGSQVGIHSYPPVTSSSGIVGKQTVYQLSFKPSMTIPTALPRKKTTKLRSKRRRSIISVEKTVATWGKCIQVEGGVYLAGRTFIPTHNSDMSTRYLPAHFIGRFPDRTVIVTGYSSSLTEGFSTDCQAIVRSDRFILLYPGVEVSKKKQSSEEWHIAGRAGKLFWPGLTGSITGKRSSLAVCDDFFSGREEAESETVRQARWETITNDLLTRADTRCIVIILATPWHTDDPFGRIKYEMANNERFPRFEFLKFPAFDDKYPTGTLFPERYNDNWYESQKAILGTYGTASLLQCDPVVKHGAKFRVDLINYYETPPDKDVKWSRGWDLALTEKQKKKDNPDYTAGIRLGVKWLPAIPGAEPMPIIYIDDFIIGRWNVHTRDKKIQAAAMTDGDIEIGIEAYGTQRESFDRISQVLHGIRKVTRTNPPKDLYARSDVLEKIFEAGNVYMRRASWNDDLNKYIAEYPGSAHDDPIAALVTAFELHKPYVKRVFPYMNDLSVTPLDIHWNKIDDNTSIHHAAIVMLKDLSMWVMCTLWDDIAGQLFVYKAEMFEEPDLGKIALWMTRVMKLKTHTVDKVLCGKTMCKASGTEKTVQQLLRAEFRRLGVKPHLRESMKYDQWGSIAQVNKVSKGKRIFFDTEAESALLQMQLWSVEKNKPQGDGYGYCECINLIVGELKRQQVFERKIKRPDYVKESVYNKRMEEMNGKKER